MNYINFTPRVYFIGGEYVVSRLFNDGLSICPTFTKIKESELEPIYGITEKDKSNIEVFAGYTIAPENDPNHYKRGINLGDGLLNFNMYELPIHPVGNHVLDIDNNVNWPNILNLILHIAPNVKPFSNSRFTYTELIMDYLAIAWKNPTQRLPILSLISKERSTGKTTFLQLIGLMFQINAKMVSMTDLSSDFNILWGLANFIMVDEARIPKNLMAKIRNESTSRSRTINAKYLPHFQIRNCSKFVMASNEIENFADIDLEENRYFVIEVQSFPSGAEKPNYVELMERELPHFLDFLTNHYQILSKEESRHWFNYEDYKTPALQKITKSSKSFVYQKVEDTLEYMNDLSVENSDECLWEFSITGLRSYLHLHKGKETEIKEDLKKLGVHSDDYKSRFTCAFSQKQTHAIRYFISMKELSSIFNEVNWELLQPAEINQNA